MNDFRHVSIAITTYCNNPGKYYSIFFYENDHGRKTIMSQEQLPLAVALQMMWQLKKLGGQKQLNVHYNCPGTCTREVELWEFDPSWGF